jgi:hypothetical protein
MKHKIKIRRGTEQQWASVNPTLAAGEPGVTTTGRIKIGNGTSAWNDLKYVSFDGGDINPTMSVAGMNVGAWGDPHLYVRKPQSLNPLNTSIGKFLARWDDNKSGTAGLKEIRLLDFQTTTDTVKIYYTNMLKSNGAKRISSMRVELNGHSTTYTNTARVVAGPVTLRTFKLGSGASAYLWFEASWGDMNNVLSFKGAMSVIVKKIAATRGYWNGGSGITRDGFGIAASSYGLSRSSFETGNLGILSEEESVGSEHLAEIPGALGGLNETPFNEDVVVDQADLSEAQSVWQQGGVEKLVDDSVNLSTTMPPV